MAPLSFMFLPTPSQAGNNSCARHELGTFLMKKAINAIILLSINALCNFAQAQFTPAVFTPVQINYSNLEPAVFIPQSYTPVQIDYSNLERSFQQYEQRSNSAHEKYSQLAKLIGEIRNLISNDYETLEWFSKNIDSKLEGVKSSLSVGDYFSAIDRAITAEGEIMSNIELIRRIQTYQEYKEIEQKINERTDLTYKQKQEWFEIYTYKFVPILSNNGEVIGAYDWITIGGPNNTRVILP